MRIDLNVPSAPRPLDTIRGDIEHHTRVLALLGAEFAVAAGCRASLPAGPAASSEKILSLKEAAHIAGVSEATFRRHLVRENAASPQDPLGVQPGGLRNAPWRISLARLQRYLRNGARS